MVSAKIVGRLALCVVMFTMASCASKTKVESDLRIKGAPDWVNEGSQALNDKGGRLFHGVGSAPTMGDQSLQISTADERARAEIARMLSSYMDVASNDYTTAANQGGDKVNQQAVSRQIKNLTQINLAGAKVIGRWRDKRTGMVYAIAELDMKHVKDTAQTVAGMNQGFKDYLRAEGDTIFDRMMGDR